MVVAVPLAPVVEGNQEQVSSVEGLEHGLAAVLGGDGLAQRAMQSAQDGGVQQEGAKMVGLALQDFLGQVVDDVAVVPGESRDEASDVVSAPQGERRQLDRGDPPFGPPVEGGDLLGRQVEPHHLIEVLRCLVGREAQIGGADLDQLAPSSQPRHRQRRVGTAGEHEVQLRRQVLQQEGHPVLDLARLDEVVVVEQQHHLVRQGVEVVEQRGEDHLDRRRLGRLQERERIVTDAGPGRPERRDHVRPEHCGIVVALVEREPRHGIAISRSRGQPFGQQRRLAEPGRGRHERQRRLGPADQELVKPWPRYQDASGPRHVELGLQQRPGHDHLPQGSVSSADAQRTPLTGRMANAPMIAQTPATPYRVP